MFPEYPFKRSELPATLVDLLRLRAQTQADDPAYTWLADGLEAGGDGGKLPGYLSYAQLDARARALAAHLQQGLRLNAGDRVLLLYPPGLEFICAFFGCLYAGVIAVPAYPPRPNRSLDRLRTIVADAGAAAALTCDAVWQLVQRQLPQTPALSLLPWTRTDSEVATSGSADAWAPPPLRAEAVAFLQYTSGSTSAPKGVMVSHANILQNEWMIQQFFRHDAQTRVLGWLPLYHDMGLIGNLLQPLYLGRPCYLMPSLLFLQRPLRWLQAISRYRITTSGGPNFGYDLCVETATPELLEGLDLSTWTLAFNGAEPVRANTLDAFSEIFSTCGFDRRAFYPCYGLAETTLIAAGGIPMTEPARVSLSAAALRENRIEFSQAAMDAESQGKMDGESQSDVQVFVSSGSGIGGDELRIVDPESLHILGEDRVGEIWVKGPHVAQGYWGQPEMSAGVFRAMAAEGAGPFLRTGDLGFISGGRLYITGRRKDLIIIRGRNYHPQDIERSVEDSHPLLRKNGAAAFSVVAGDEERLVVVAEVERDQVRKPEGDATWQALAAAVRRAVIEQHEVPLAALYCLRPYGLPKTSSGKVRRSATRQDLEGGKLELAHPGFVF